MKGEEKEGDQKKRRLETIENDIRAVGLCVGDGKNPEKWRFRAKVAAPKLLGEKEDIFRVQHTNICGFFNLPLLSLENYTY